MFDITEEDVSAVYERLKDRYTLTLTNTLAVDGGFRVVSDFGYCHVVQTVPQQQIPSICRAYCQGLFRQSL
jgi:hypothetical protein